MQNKFAQKNCTLALTTSSITTWVKLFNKLLKNLVPWLPQEVFVERLKSLDCTVQSRQIVNTTML